MEDALWKLRVIEICCCGMNLIFDSWLTRPHHRGRARLVWGHWPIRDENREAATNQGAGLSKPCIGISHCSAVTWHRPHFKYPHPQFQIGLQDQWSLWSRWPRQEDLHSEEYHQDQEDYFLFQYFLILQWIYVHFTSILKLKWCIF